MQVAPQAVASPLPGAGAPDADTGAPPASSTPPGSAGVGWSLADAGWAAVFLAAAALLQLMQPAPWDADTGYHLAVARLLREHGILHRFPWTPFSDFAEHYADKELLLHALLAALWDLGPASAARAAGTLMGGGVLFLLYRILRQERVQGAGLWSLLALVSSGAFAVRFASVRPHLFSVALVLLTVWAAARRRFAALALAGLLWPLSYIAWHLSLVVVAMVEGARVAGGQRLSPRPAVVVALALAAALLVHPNFPENLRLFRLVVVEILWRKAWGGLPGFDMGGEFRPFSLPGVGRFLGVPLLLTALALPFAWRRRRHDALPLGAALVAAAFVALSLRTQRFVEYASPTAALAAGLALHRLWRGRAAAAAVVVATAWTGLFGMTPVLWMRERTDMFPPVTVSALARLVPENAQVFTCGWEFTGEMMLALPERRFIVATDPVPFWVKDPERYRLWYDLTHRPPAGPLAATIRERFGATRVLCEDDPRFRRFLATLAADPGARPLAHLGPWWLFALSSPGSPPPEAP